MPSQNTIKFTHISRVIDQSDYRYSTIVSFKNVREKESNSTQLRLGGTSITQIIFFCLFEIMIIWHSIGKNLSNHSPVVLGAWLSHFIADWQTRFQFRFSALSDTVSSSICLSVLEIHWLLSMKHFFLSL